VAIQERAVYLYEYVGGDEGARAWADVGGQVALLRGDPVAKGPYEIDCRRYVPMAQRIVRDFHSHHDADLVPAVRLVGAYKVGSEVAFLHRMAHDRSMDLRREVAWALGRIHDPASLPVLAGMMQAQGTRSEVGCELIRWGDAAVPHIVALIALSTDSKLEHRENTIGEDMVRAYLDHWDMLGPRNDARVVAAVRAALAAKDPSNGLISTEYLTEYLARVAGRRP
jgi:hypothetical protein